MSSNRRGIFPLVLQHSKQEVQSCKISCLGTGRSPSCLRPRDRLLSFYIAAYYTIVDFNALFASPFPSIVGAVYLTATENKVVTMVLMIIVLAPAFFACFSYFLANIRLLYGFTREGAGKCFLSACLAQRSCCVLYATAHLCTVVALVLMQCPSSPSP
jgi:hypothetical protein